MSFDQNRDEPLIEPKNSHTKINLWMAVGIIVFFSLGAFVLFNVAEDPPDNRQEATEVSVP